MTVYELIKVLSKSPADADVYINVTPEEKTVECERCEEEILVQREVFEVSDFEIKQVGSYTVNIFVEE